MLQGTGLARAPVIVGPTYEVRRSRAALNLVPHLLMIAKNMRAILGIKLAALDLVAGQDQMLLVLQPRETMSGCRLAETLSVRPSTVSKMIDRLIEKDLITRAGDPTDARKVRVGLTQSGEAVRSRVQVVLADLETEFVHALGEDTDTTTAAVGTLEQVLASRLRRLR